MDIVILSSSYRICSVVGQLGIALGMTAAGLVLSAGFAIAAPSCDLPIAGQGPTNASDALHALATAEGDASCSLRVCDADGSGTVTPADARQILRSGLGNPVALDCPLGPEAKCGSPVAGGPQVDSADARAVLATATGLRDCPQNVCDVDASGSVGAVDALRVALAADGQSNTSICPDQPSPRARGTRVVPGQNGCTNLLIYERCRVRSRGGPKHSARVSCRGRAQGGLPIDFSPSTEAISFFVDDADGPCFEATVSSPACSTGPKAVICKDPVASVSRLKFRVKANRPDRFSLVARTAGNLPCLGASSSPWIFGLMVGDECGEVACPVQQKRPICPGTCGNGIRDAGELCDEGTEGSANCTSTCVPAGCGNGTVEAGEDCDDHSETATCDSDCSEVVCGDGYTNVAAGEQCDDGNTSAGDGCDPNCAVEGCGNGVVEPGEDCDDGGESSICNADCTNVVCGDGITNAAAGEECDTSVGSLGCEDRGFSFGTLACDPSTCLLDTTGCALLDHRCGVTIGVTSGDDLGALQYDIDYGAASGEFVGEAGDVDCVSLVSGGFAAFNDKDSLRTLTGAVISLAGFVGPTDVARCRFDTNDAALDAASFPLSVVDASDPQLNPRTPSVAVTSVSCGQNTTTTTMPMSTTTTTLQLGARFDIEVSLEDNVLLGALQYRLNYVAAPGDILGAADQANCTDLTGAGIYLFNNVQAERSLRHAAITLSGMQGPRAVSSCVFRTIGPRPVATDFEIVVEDASDTSLLPVAVTLRISSITKR